MDYDPSQPSEYSDQFYDPPAVPLEPAPNCPHCGNLCVGNTVKKNGENFGKAFWSCKGYEHQGGFCNTPKGYFAWAKPAGYARPAQSHPPQVREAVGALYRAAGPGALVAAASAPPPAKRPVPPAGLQGPPRGPPTPDQQVRISVIQAQLNRMEQQLKFITTYITQHMQPEADAETHDYPEEHQ